MTWVYFAARTVEIAKAPAGTWTGKLETAETAALFTSFGLRPKKRKTPRSFSRCGTQKPRVNGKIPGGCIGLLGEGVKEFVRGKSTTRRDESDPQAFENYSSRVSMQRTTGSLRRLLAIARLSIAAVSESHASAMVLEEELRAGRFNTGRAAEHGAGKRTVGRGSTKWPSRGMPTGAPSGGVSAGHSVEDAHPDPQRRQ